MVSEKLNENNFLLYAMHHYDNPQCHSVQEFEEDMKKFLYLKKLLSRYKNNDELRERLVLNHIVVLCNVFSPEIAARLLFFKVAKEDYSALKTYLLFLSVMPEKIKGIKGQDIQSSEIPVDFKIAEVLREIK